MMKQHLPELKIIFGGPAVKKWSLIERKDFDQKAGENYILDVAVIGEGELSALEVMDRFQTGQPLDGCLGIGYRDQSGQVVFTGTRANMNLLDLPIPYFGDFDFNLYREVKLPVMMSRGCVAKCTFCSETRFWNKYRFRDANHIFEEFKNNYYRYGIGVYAMADSLINGNFKVLSDLADLIIASGMKIEWHGYARIDKRMTKELVGRLAKSGLSFVSYGLETGSQKIMDLMEKRTTVETAREVIRETHKAGIGVHLNMIVGFPGETEEDFQQTLQFLEENIEFISVINTGETLSIGMDTPLGMTPGKFDVRVKADGFIDWDQDGRWVSVDGSNTYSVRRARLERLRNFLDQFDHVLQFPGGKARKLRNIAPVTHGLTI